MPARSDARRLRQRGPNAELAACNTLAKHARRTLSRAVQSQKRRTAVVVELDSQPALLPGLRGWRERRPTSLLPCTALCTSRRRHSDARPRCFSTAVTHWYQVVCLERVSAIRTTSEARAAAAPYARASAWRRSCRVLRRATVDDDGGRGNTARNARRVVTAPSTTVAERLLRERRAGPKVALDQQSFEVLVAWARKNKRWRGPGLVEGDLVPRVGP